MRIRATEKSAYFGSTPMFNWISACALTGAVQSNRWNSSGASGVMPSAAGNCRIRARCDPHVAGGVDGAGGSGGAEVVFCIYNMLR